jgi:hypothetical protein
LGDRLDNADVADRGDVADGVVGEHRSSDVPPT